MDKSPPAPNFALISSANDNPAPTVVIPANITLPPEDIVPPTPAAPTSRPPRAVTIPTESTLVTSSYVKTPVNVAATPVIFLMVRSPPAADISPVEVVTPVIITPLVVVSNFLPALAPL